MFGKIFMFYIQIYKLQKTNPPYHLKANLNGKYIRLPIIIVYRKIAKNTPYGGAATATYIPGNNISSYHIPLPPPCPPEWSKI